MLKWDNWRAEPEHLGGCGDQVIQMLKMCMYGVVGHEGRTSDIGSLKLRAAPCGVTH